jgi:dTDP-4-amino-4,6-dideoxygalactose transaminase
MTGDDITRLALLGGKASFSDPKHIGQMNLPERGEFEKAFRGIFTRRYYTNHGPLAQELESRLASFLNVRHTVTMANGTIARMLAAKALDISGKVIVPAFSTVPHMQSLSWVGAQPLFCDVDPKTHHIAPEQATALLEQSDGNAIFPVHMWGNLCNTEFLDELARRKGIPICYDAAHAFGCARHGNRAGSHGKLEIFSFNATNVFNTLEGACVCTNDDHIAERLRNLRSSYGRREIVDIPINGNGRFSEAQAAMGLLCLERYSSNVQENSVKFELYCELLSGIDGIRIIYPYDPENFNYQMLVIEIDHNAFGLTRNELIRLLEAENISHQNHFMTCASKFTMSRGRHRQAIMTFPVAEMLHERVMQLCLGQDVTLQDIRTICDLIGFIHDNAESLHGFLLEEK